MTLAMKKLKNFGWLALVLMVTIMLYPLSLNVASVHSDLVRVDKRIRETKREISFLQAELRTRASMQQLAEWNDLLYGYAPPTSDQFIEGEKALAQLDGDAPEIKPVLIAVTDAAGEIGKAGAMARNVDGRIQTSNSIQVALNSPPKAEKGDPPDEPAIAGNSKGRTERMAKIDDKLLSDNLLKDIDKAAAKERRRR